MVVVRKRPRRPVGRRGLSYVVQALPSGRLYLASDVNVTSQFALNRLITPFTSLDSMFAWLSQIHGIAGASAGDLVVDLALRLGPLLRDR